MKKSVCICLYFGISYLMLGAFETKAQVVSTTLSITLHPYLSVSVNPVFPMGINARKIGGDIHHVDFNTETLEQIRVRSNEAFEIQVKHLDPFYNAAVMLFPQVLSNSDKIGIAKQHSKSFDEEAVGMPNGGAEIKDHKISLSAATRITQYSITAL